MAFDDVLAERIRDAIADVAPDMPIAEKRMFGGLVFLLGGHITVGVWGDDLLARVPLEEREELLAQDGVRPFEMKGRLSKGGWLVVAGDVLDDDVLRTWVDRGVSAASAVPPS